MSESISGSQLYPSYHFSPSSFLLRVALKKLRPESRESEGSQSKFSVYLGLVEQAVWKEEYFLHVNWNNNFIFQSLRENDKWNPQCHIIVVLSEHLRYFANLNIL